MENGETFVPAASEPTNSKKRKNTWGGKKGSSKRHRGDSDIDSDSSEESESESNSDSESDSDDSTEDQDTMEEAVTEQSLKEKLKECLEAIKAARERNNEARRRKKEVGDALSSLEKALVQVQKEKNAFCSLKRSEVGMLPCFCCLSSNLNCQFSRDVLKEDFRTGLKDLDGESEFISLCFTHIMADAAAEERDPDNFDPTRNLRGKR